MSEKEVKFKGGKAYLEWSERVACLFIRDVTNHIPIHEDENYDNKELKEVLDKLIKEKNCEDSLKWVRRLTRNAIRDFQEDGDLQEFLDDSIGFKRVEHYEELDSLLTVMNTPIKLEEGTLFQHVWDYIEKDYEVFNVLFTDSLGGFDLQEWIEHARVPYEKGTWDIECEQGGHGMEKLQCYWNYTIGQGEYSTFKGEFGGWGTCKWPVWENDEHVRDDIKETSYSVSFTPINRMMEYPFELLEEIKIERLEVWDGKEYSFPELKPAIDTNKDWTPYTMIEAILWEISFMGTPQQQDEKSDGIQDTMDKIKSGEMKTYPAKEFLDQLREDLSVEENEKELEEGHDDPEEEDA